MGDNVTFGGAVSRARKGKGLSQRELAARIRREDGAAISPQYLSDIEHDRRNPSSDHLVRQFATVLEIDADYLYYLANRIPEDIRNSSLSEEKVSELMVAFRGKPSNMGEK